MFLLRARAFNWPNNTEQRQVDPEALQHADKRTKSLIKLVRYSLSATKKCTIYEPSSYLSNAAVEQRLSSLFEGQLCCCLRRQQP